MDTNRCFTAGAALFVGASMACSPTTGQTGLVVSVASDGPVDCVLIAASAPGGEPVQAQVEVPDPSQWRDVSHRVLIYSGGALGDDAVELSLTGHRGDCDAAPVAEGKASSRFEQGRLVDVAVTLALTGEDADGDGYADEHDCAPNDPLIFPRDGDERGVCDGLDNDCDGDVDEGCPCTEPLPCHPTGRGSAIAGVGACVLGEQACVAGRLGGCQGAGMPSEDICDGVDNDCDGRPDPDCRCETGETRDCYEAGPARLAGVGACVRGIQTCDGERFGPCVGDVAPSREICNDVDDDCDGQVDEDALPEQCELTQGVCAGATRACDTMSNDCVANDYVKAASARGTSYRAIETAEHCDGADNDCDGVIDEGCSCVPGTVEACHPMGATTSASATGQCRRGTRRCLPDGVWGDCQSYVAATSEICDGIDNDCDGSIDEGFEGEGEPCSTGVPGVCEAGVLRCVAATLTCVSLEQTSSEICNGRDDDCDGQTDEDFDRLSDPANCGTSCVRCDAGSTCCNGTCRNIVSDDANCGACGVACAAGKTCCQGQCFDFDVDNRHCGACGVACTGGNVCRTGQCVPSKELACHDGDDDLDGKADCADSDCEEGAICSAPGAAHVATCQGGVCVADSEWSCSNGLDDDQNGSIDCKDKACGDGAVCNANAGTCCGGNCVNEDKCDNGKDDDCDGLVDCEDPDCAGQGPAELCNGRDDNCDGVIDEGFNVGDACAVGVGACREESVIICLSQQESACKATPGTPSREICNGIDDDCDGELDEAPECGGPEVDVAEGSTAGWATASSNNDTLRPCETGGANSVTLSMVTDPMKAGTHSLQLAYGGANYFQSTYPANRDANWDLSTRTGVHFQVRAEQPNGWDGWDPNGPTIVLCSPNGRAVYTPPNNLLSTTWLEVSLPLNGGNGWTRTVSGTFDPTHVDQVEFHANPKKGNGRGTAHLYLDDVRFY